MSARTRISRALSVVLPGGAIGASIVLALSCAATDAAVSKASTPQAPSSQDGVAERLRAIRAGVAELTTPPDGAGSAAVPAGDAAAATPTWWGNGGWGRWHMGWGNGGFGWPNGWHNWGNGWHNWGNGWHNFWHNW
jgi:rSAM-associated Gly-rich repeat protein